MNLDQLEVKTDRRGSLVEAFKLPNDGQVFYVIAEPGEVRGNHYHLRKTEHFLVVYGSATMQIKDRTTNNVMNVEVTGQKPMLISVFPNHTHNIVANEGGAIFMVWCDEQYDLNDIDTYPEEI